MHASNRARRLLRGFFGGQSRPNVEPAAEPLGSDRPDPNAIAPLAKSPAAGHSGGMTAQTIHRLFAVRDALHAPLVLPVIVGLAVVLTAFPIALAVAGDRVASPMRRELWDRYRSWLVFIPLMFVPVLLGAAATIAAVGLLGVLCHREFARATGLFRHPATSATVVAGIAAVAFAVADHWYEMFASLPPIFIAMIAATALWADRPADYLQRVSLGVVAFLLFGVCLGHLGYWANDARYRSVLVWLVVCVEGNDILAFCCGKTLGGPKLAPHTSPNKTVGGAVGAVVCTTATVTLLGRVALAGTGVDTWAKLVPLGVLISVSAQLGDLTLSSVKRNLGIKDWAATFPGHGGLLDRFNSLLFAAPAAFHYVGFFHGVGLDQPARIFTGTP